MTNPRNTTFARVTTPRNTFPERSHRERRHTHRYNAETQVKRQAERGGSRNSKTANRLSECTLESHCRRRRGESVPHITPPAPARRARQRAVPAQMPVADLRPVDAAPETPGAQYTPPRTPRLTPRGALHAAALACCCCSTQRAHTLRLEFRSETGFLSTFTAQRVRIFIAHQMNSVFLWSICFFTRCIRNQHFRIFYFKMNHSQCSAKGYNSTPKTPDRHTYVGIKDSRV